MDKPKDTLGLLQDEHQKENINAYNKFGNRSDFMIHQDNPRAILSQSSVNGPNILQPSQLTQNQYKANNQIREDVYRQSIDLKNNQALPQLKDRVISQKERKAASLEKESLHKSQQVRNIMISKDLNQCQNDQRRQSLVQNSQVKSMESSQQYNNNNNLQTPRSREQNSATTKDSLGIYLSSQKKLQKISSSPSDQAVNQQNNQFNSFNEFKDIIDEERKQKPVFNQSNKKLVQPNTFYEKREEINEDKFTNIDVSLNTLTQQKGKNYYNRAQTAQENQVNDKGIKRDSQTIDVESIEATPNINVGLIQDQKLILNHLKKQSQNQQNNEKSQNQNTNQSKDYDGANITFYPKQSSKKNVNKIQTNEQNEAKYQSQQQTKVGFPDYNKDALNEGIKGVNEGSLWNMNQSNQKVVIINQKIEESSRRSSYQNQQIGLINPQSYQQKSLKMQQQYINQSEVFQQQAEPNIIQTQPDFSYNNQINNSHQYMLSEGQQLDQIEQIPKNQMKFHNLYQKNISYSKNNSISQGFPNAAINKYGPEINFLDQQSSNMQNQNNYNRQNQLKSQQIPQQRAFNNFPGQLKRQLNLQGSQQIDIPYSIPQGHHRSNSHHLDTKINKPNSFLMTNQFEGSIRDCFQKDQKSIKGNNDKCNLSFDLRVDNQNANQYYSDNKQRHQSTNQHDMLISKQKNKRNESVDLLETNNIQNNADMSRFKNNQNSKNINSIQCTQALKSEKQLLNQQLNQIQQTFATSIAQNNQISGINQVKKLSDICLPQLEQQNKSRNESLNANQTKKITLSSLKIQPNSQLNQISQPIQLCVDKFTFNTQKNTIKTNNKITQNQNQNFNIIDSKTGQFGLTLNANQIRSAFQEPNNQQNEPSSQILKKNVANKNNETNAQIKDQNIDTEQADQSNNQILEETGRFGQEQLQETQKKNQKQLIINLNDNNNNNAANKQKYLKNEQSNQYQNKTNNQRQLRDSLIGTQLDPNISKKTSNIQLYNNSGLISDGTDILTSQNPNSIINIPVITTNFGLNSSQGISKPNTDNLNQGTLLINYNFPLAESLQYRSKYQQSQQKQILDIQNNYINYTQKKVSSAISCKRKDDFYSQFDSAGNDILDKQQRARSSNNRFPREIFTPNVQKAKRLYNQNKQNLNFNNCANAELQNEFIQ